MLNTPSARGTLSHLFQGKSSDLLSPQRLLSYPSLPFPTALVRQGVNLERPLAVANNLSSPHRFTGRDILALYLYLHILYCMLSEIELCAIKLPLSTLDSGKNAITEGELVLLVRGG